MCTYLSFRWFPHCINALLQLGIALPEKKNHCYLYNTYVDVIFHLLPCGANCPNIFWKMK